MIIHRDGQKSVHGASASSLFGNLEIDLSGTEMSACTQLNISQCHWTDTNKEPTVMLVYNPTAHNRDVLVKLPHSDTESLEVNDANGDVIELQTVTIPDEVQSLPERISTAKVESVFMATDVPPLGI